MEDYRDCANVALQLGSQNVVFRLFYRLLITFFNTGRWQNACKRSVHTIFIDMVRHLSHEQIIKTKPKNYKMMPAAAEEDSGLKKIIKRHVRTVGHKQHQKAF